MAKVTTKKKANGKAERAVLVTTKHRGVFFGYAKSTVGDAIQLRACRNVLFWDSAVRGFLGLAKDGPNTKCRIGPSADFEAREITGVAEVTPEAVARFEAAPWA